MKKRLLSKLIMSGLFITSLSSLPIIITSCKPNDSENPPNQTYYPQINKEANVMIEWDDIFIENQTNDQNFITFNFKNPINVLNNGDIYNLREQLVSGIDESVDRYYGAISLYFKTDDSLDDIIDGLNIERIKWDKSVKSVVYNGDFGQIQLDNNTSFKNAFSSELLNKSMKSVLPSNEWQNSDYEIDWSDNKIFLSNSLSSDVGVNFSFGPLANIVYKIVDKNNNANKYYFIVPLSNFEINFDVEVDMSTNNNSSYKDKIKIDENNRYSKSKIKLIFPVVEQDYYFWRLKHDIIKYFLINNTSQEPTVDYLMKLYNLYDDKNNNKIDQNKVRAFLSAYNIEFDKPFIRKTPESEQHTLLGGYGKYDLVFKGKPKQGFYWPNLKNEEREFIIPIETFLNDAYIPEETIDYNEEIDLSEYYKNSEYFVEQGNEYELDKKEDFFYDCFDGLIDPSKPDYSDSYGLKKQIYSKYNEIIKDNNKFNNVTPYEISTITPSDGNSSNQEWGIVVSFKPTSGHTFKDIVFKDALKLGDFKNESKEEKLEQIPYVVKEKRINFKNVKFY